MKLYLCGKFAFFPANANIYCNLTAGHDGEYKLAIPEGFRLVAGKYYNKLIPIVLGRIEKIKDETPSNPT